MNADDNPLDFVWATFKTTRDCLKVADKVRTQANVNWLQKTDFIFLSETEASERLKTCHDESEKKIQGLGRTQKSETCTRRQN